MRKKSLALLLSLVLMISVSVPALAAEDDLDSRLTSVTLEVKETLGIGDGYTAFSGDFWTKGALRYWNLNWENETESLSVMADDGGKIYSHYRYLKNERYEYSNDFAPAFPSVTRAEAEKSAQAFLNRVLGAGESVAFEEQSTSPTEGNSYYFYGTLQISGLDTPIRVNLSVRAADKSVTNFSRDDSYTAYVGEIPSTDTALTASQAAAKLRAKLSLELRYVSETDGEDGTRAVLRYVPVYSGSYVVDAKSGELINMDALYESLGQDGDMAGYGRGSASTEEAAASDTADKRTLTEAEQAGIRKLEGVRGEEQLDATVRGMQLLGVTDAYTLGTVDYNQNQETGEVTASLSYWIQIEEAAQAGITDAEYKELQEQGYEPYARKYITVDAKTASLQALYTYYSGFGWEETSGDKEPEALPAATSDFITSWHEKEYTNTALYSAVCISNGPLVQDNYIYARTAEGYFYPDNQVFVSVNRNTGYLDELFLNWTEDVTFADARGIITEAAALASYADAFKPMLSYRNLPVAIDPENPEMVPYIEMGYRYVYRMALVYSLESSAPVSGIDAKTGEVISPAAENDEEITYSDLSGTYAESKIEELAQFGVGYYGGQFRPYAQLTQRDMLLLLVSAQGYRFDPAEIDEDYLYSAAYSLGILDVSERDPDAAVTRAEVVKTLVKMSGYGKAAELPGIYICGFKDDRDIPEALYGYIAIGKGLGILNGYADNTARPNQTATRLEAAIMLYNFMDRDR